MSNARFLRSRPAVLVGLLALAMMYLAYVYLLLTRVLVFLHYNDFGKFYYALEQARRGESLYAPSPATLIPFSASVSHQFWNLNPPHFHLLLWPLSYLPIGWACVVWMGANVFVGVLAGVAVHRELQLRLSPGGNVAAVVYALAAAPTLCWLVTGQLTGLLLGLTTWIWIDMRRQRWVRAGLITGVACSLKLFVAPLVLFLLLRRRWTAVGAAVISALLCFAAGILVFGINEQRHWISALRSVNWEWAVMNASASAPIARALAPDPLKPIAVPVWGALAGTAMSVSILAIGVWGSLRAREPDAAVCILYLTCLLASPLGWVYYHWMLVGPLLATFRNRLRDLGVVCAGFLIPFFLLFPWHSPAFAITLGSLYSWSTVALWGFAIAESRRTENVPVSA